MEFIDPFPFPRVRIDSRIGCEKSRNEGGRGGPNVPKEVVADVSRDAKGVLASKTNSYPQQPLLAVFFADNLLLAAWFTTRVLEDQGEQRGWKK